MRFEAQGFEVLSINGHDYEEINKALEQAKNPQNLVLSSQNNYSKGCRRA